MQNGNCGRADICPSRRSLTRSSSASVMEACAVCSPVFFDSIADDLAVCGSYSERDAMMKSWHMDEIHSRCTLLVYLLGTISHQIQGLVARTRVRRV